MANTLFITLHAVAATLAFGAGVLSAESGRFLGVYRAAMAVMLAALVPAVLVDWAITDTTARAVFAGLIGLAGVMVVRAELAVRRSPVRTGGPTAAYLEHLGFTLIALADGFAVVAAVRGGAPGWAVGVLAVGVVAVGHLTLQLAKRRLVCQAVAVGAA
ncbi:hypothetical protein E4P39_12725 [Blastococcus sp. CT_GayMR19]|uniref:hypothetical protein n=1 Tax=Blastococcus sp. CT_GayMR19 TaxID=2559608 RepID=UPI001073127B|nr:hypothetical protein [Blastococcus sp. CT_GayMR19]TFV74355.1 hypothetical protein E4P39_12725 [Blastococcus sp. CT_GayMR19]